MNFGAILFSLPLEKCVSFILCTYLEVQQLNADLPKSATTVKPHCYGHPRDCASDLNGELTALQGLKSYYLR